MFQRMTDPWISFVVVILGSLALSVVLGTIDACRSKGPKPTLAIRVGARWMAALIRMDWTYSTAEIPGNPDDLRFMNPQIRGSSDFGSALGQLRACPTQSLVDA